MPPLVFVVAAWLAGLILAHHWLVPAGVAPAAIALLGIVPVAAIVLWREDRSMRLACACSLALLLAALRYYSALPDLDDPGLVAHYNGGGWLTVEGVVTGYPDARDTWTNLRLQAEVLEIDGQARPVRGLVLMRVPRYPTYNYGDRLRVSGWLETPPELEGFSYRGYLARQNVYSMLDRPQIELLASGKGNPFWTALYAVKDRARASLARLVPDPEAALLQGIVLGIRSGIPADLYDDYNATGTSHIIVISGANLTVVMTLFSLIFGRLLGRRPAYWLTVVALAGYVLLVGAEAAVVRAGLMGGLYVTALYLGRRSKATVSLLASALFLTALNPLALWDAGFQLSFAATISLVLFTPPLERTFEAGLKRVVAPERARQVVLALKDVLIVTLAAQVLTLPVIVYHFQRLSLVAPLANLLIQPVQPPIMALGGASALVGLLSPLEPLARAIAWIPWLCLAYTDAVVRWLAIWPWASLAIDPASARSAVLLYAAALSAVWAWRRGGQTLRRALTWATVHGSTALMLGLPAAAAVLIWLAVAQLPDGRLHVAFLDVGQGDAILITTPTGQQILVDGGPSPSALTTALGSAMPFWDHSLDLVTMTHPDADHIAGLPELLARFNVGAWLDSAPAAEDALYLECKERLAAAGTARYTVRGGDRLNLGQGIVLEVLQPPRESMTGAEGDANDQSLVLRLVWGQARFLLTGDIGAQGERLLLESGQPLAAEVLKVAHHGSDGSSTAAFLGAVAPRYAVLSVGAGNSFGHPAPEVLDRLAALGEVKALRTDKQGTVELVTDGERLWVKTDR
jgi:competence protein ComEC